MSKKKIIDEYTDLPVSRQRKWALRNREKFNEYQRQWRKTESGKLSMKATFNKIKSNKEKDNGVDGSES